MKVHLSRWVCLDVDSNLARAEAEAASAAGSGADLVVFPESFLHGYSQRCDPSRARAMFARASAAAPRTLMLFGTLSEEGRNRLTVWREGREAARYDKVHLFGPNGENDLWEPGPRYVALRTGGHTFGLVTCNDIRFPEQARALRLEARCEALLVPAWWPWRRDHVWATLLKARAIENGMWALGCCVTACEHPSESFAGAGNYVFDPGGEQVLTADDRTYEVDWTRGIPPVVDTAESFRAVNAVVVLDA